MSCDFTDNDMMKIYDEWENTYWWNVGRKKILKTIFDALLVTVNKNNKLLDIGCGVGNDMVFLNNYGQTYGLDLSHTARPYWVSKGLKKMVIGDGSVLPFKDGTFSVVAAFDFLEHLEFDGPCISEMHRVAKKGSFLLVTVPAYNFMMAPGSDPLHYRRYCLGELKNKLKAAGFKMEKATYFNTFLFPLMLVEKMYEKVRRKREFPLYVYKYMPTVLNDCLRFIFSLEAPLLKKSSFPFGSSILLIGRKE